MATSQTPDGPVLVPDILLFGTAGDDTLTGGPGDDQLSGAAGNDRLEAESGNDQLNGGEGDDVLVAGSGCDTLAGGPGQDTLLGGSGDDLVFGGGGVDTLFLVLGRDSVAIGRDPSGKTTLTYLNGEMDTLVGVEKIEFGSETVFVTDETTETGFVFRLYNAAFGRQADEDFEFWLDRASEGVARLTIANAFVESPEFEDIFGADLAADDFVKAMYQNVLGRIADGEGRAFWRDRLEDGRLTEAQVLIAFAESPENREQTDPILDDGLTFG